MFAAGSKRLAPLVALLACTAGYSVRADTAGDDPLAVARQAFLLAYAATEAGAPLPPAIANAALRDYPLYPYLERARIAKTLATASGTDTPADRQAAEFLATHRGEPVTLELRRSWLRSLARRGDGPTLIAEFRPEVADAALGCQLLSAEIAVGGTAGLSERVVARWLTSERLPTECEAPFQWLRDQGAMTDELIERRVRLLLENGEPAFARTVARRLPNERRAPLEQWAKLIEQPAAALDELVAAPDLAVAPDALLAGWRRLARNDPPAALARHEQLLEARDLDDDDASRAALALALGLAWDRRADDALDAFADVAEAHLDDTARAWQARAALWAGEWRTAERAIAAMSPAQRGQTRWRYWEARVAGERGDTARAEELYTAVLPTDNFFAGNAAARLGRGAVPHPAPLPADDAAIAAIAAQPAFVRARELKLIGLDSAAVSEWLAGIAALDEHGRAQAIHLAARWQWYDLAVTTATRESVFFDYELLYPRPYAAEIGTAAGAAAVQAPLLYGVVRQESLYRADAVSAAGALGLAQLMPDTARIVARGLQQPPPRTADLLDPAVNARLGAQHLRDLVDHFDGQTFVALAAYNAGRLAAERWLPSEPLAADIWIENIPFNETRDYVQRVAWHSVVFDWLDSGTARDLDTWLAPVAPRAN